MASFPRRSYDIVSAIAANMQIVCAHHQAPHHGPDELRRCVYTIKVDQRLFDEFFNAETGYRGWYFHSPEHGMTMNRHLIDVLTPALVDAGRFSSVARSELVASLAGWSAKVWLAESGNKIDGRCPVCDGEWSLPQDDIAQILNGRWEVPCSGKDESKRNWGRHAPEGTRLRIFGAFLNRAYEEWVPASKIRRADEINRLGWS